MWPTILSIGPLAIQSFGLMMALGVFFGGFVFWQKGREEGLAEEMLMDSWLVAGVGGLIFGRLVHVMTNWSFFEGSLYRILFLTKFPGLAYEGVLIGALLAMVLKAQKHKLETLKWLEVGVGAMLLVEIFGMVGSFLAGSYLGKATNWFWGLGFPGNEGRRHPVQLLSLVVLLVISKLLKKWEKEYRGFKWYKSEKGEAKTGFLVGAYLGMLGGLRFLVSFLMDKIDWFGLGLAVLGVIVVVVRMGKKPVGQSDGDKKTVKKENFKSKKVVKTKRKKQGFDFK